MVGVSAFIKDNGQWDHTWKFASCKMKEVMAITTFYLGYIELLINVLGRGYVKRL